MMNIPVMKLSRYFAAFSGVIILAGIIVMLVFGGLNLGIDFSGGTLMMVEMGGEFDVEEVRAAVGEFVTTEYRVDTSDVSKAIIRLQDKDLDPEAQNQIRSNIIDSLVESYPEIDVESTDRVGAVAGNELITNAITSVLIASGLMLIYIWIRFELLSGFAALVALGHDVLIMTAIIAITRTQVNSSFIAAILTIVGYSINDTIVVFDRIRENMKRFGRQMTRSDIVNKSINQTMARSINTSLTTLFTIITLYVLGVSSIKEFALPLIIGILSGTYSSIFIASPFWVLSHKWDDMRKEKHKTKKA